MEQLCDVGDVCGSCVDEYTPGMEMCLELDGSDVVLIVWKYSFLYSFFEIL